MNLVLIIPDHAYKETFTAMVNDFYASQELDKYAIFKPALENFSTYIMVLQQVAQGTYLPSGHVPAHTYWLTDNSKTIYGTIRYRPVLNTFLNKIGGHIGFDIAPAHRGKGYGTPYAGFIAATDR